MKKYLVLENDRELPERLQRYLSVNSIVPDVINMADQTEIKKIAEKFAQADVLIFQPTLITFAQYNSMLMLLYDFISKDTLKIKEIYIFTSKDMVAELTELWGDKRKYLDIVLKHVDIYSINMFGSKFEKEKINL